MVKIAMTPANGLNAVGIVIALYLMVLLGETVHHNYVLSQQVTQLRGEIVNLNDQKEQLTYNLQYYATDSFKEREGRAKLGLQLPGENVLILPKAASTSSPQSQAEPASVKHRSNFRQWLDFLSGNG